ncbi:MAG: cytochrome P450 [Pseudomonadota bacterium]
MALTPPEIDVDLYADEAIQAPWPVYARLRAAAPVVRLPALDAYALTRHAAVRAALRDHETFRSGEGVAGDDFGCAYLRGNTVASDPPRHTALRAAMAPPLSPAAIAQARPRIAAEAEALIERLCARDGFDAVEDLARHLPLSVVRDLVGLPDQGRENMLRWAAAAFDVLGVQNARGRAGREAIEEMRRFIGGPLTRETLSEGGWTRRILDLAEAGALDPELAPFAVRDYINPSLDTTISAISRLIEHLGRDPQAWQALRADRSLALNAAHEAVRLATPIRAFSRRAARDVEIEGFALPAGARVLMLFASANRDALVFEDPDRFDLRRGNARRHLGFGAGIHMCVGMHLALAEMECLIEAMAARVARIEVGEGAPVMNNTICALARLPARFVPA